MFRQTTSIYLSIYLSMLARDCKNICFCSMTALRLNLFVLSLKAASSAAFDRLCDGMWLVMISLGKRPLADE